MLTAAKIFYPSRGEMPAPAYTDFSHIFICKEAKNDEKALMLKHEQAHIWLNHNSRSPDTDIVDKCVWQIACEMEIARNFYTKDDEEKISRPFSVINGGYVAGSFPSMPPEILLAEDIYNWLIANPDQKPKSKNFCVCDEGGEKLDTGEIIETPSKEKMEEIMENLERIALKVTEEKYEGVFKTKKKPSLASEIDYILRSRKVRKRTFMRETRRQVDGVILRGRKKIKKSPRIEIFVDRSGSMSGEKTGASIAKLNIIMKKYHASVKNDVFYFSNGKIYNHDVKPNGGNPYPLVMAHLEKSRPSIAVIITDYDLEETKGLMPLSHKATKILCVPVCAERTAISSLIGAKELI